MLDLLNLFESQRANLTLGRGGNEINGLKKDSSPENCAVLGSFSRPTTNEDRREFYLLQQNDYLVLLRICTASGSDYDEFVVIHGATNSLEEVIKLKNTFDRWNS